MSVVRVVPVGLVERAVFIVGIMVGLIQNFILNMIYLEVTDSFRLAVDRFVKAVGN